MQQAERHRLIVDNLPLVGYLVSELCARATHLSREDLAAVGAVGLVLAADAYDPSTGVPFGAYARLRITGALTDELRSMDWAGRGTRQRIKSLKSVMGTLTAELARTPTDAELASATGLTVEQVRSALSDSARTVGPLDDAAEALASDTIAPEEAALERERTAYLGAAVGALPDRMRHIVTAVYLEGRAVKDVAADLGLTSSAVSQQRSEALRLLRGGLETFYADDVAPAAGTHPGAEGATRGAAPAAPAASTPRRAAYLEDFGGAVHGLRRGLTRPVAARYPAFTGPVPVATLGATG